MPKFFVILSRGAYSDYFPTYYMGDIEITSNKLTKKAESIGDSLYEDYFKLPERKSTSQFSLGNEMERYDPVTLKKVDRPSFKEFIPLMEKWLFEKGYSKLSEDIPEVNIYYDIPTTKVLKQLN